MLENCHFLENKHDFMKPFNECKKKVSVYLN